MAEENGNEVLRRSWFWTWVKYLVKYHWRGLVLFLWPVVCIPILLVENTAATRCLYVLCVMALFWVTEALPLPVTSVIPIGLFPLMGILHSKETTVQYFQETVVMFWGSMVLAFALEKCGLTVRIALIFMRLFGTTHRRLTFGLSFFTMLLSMWMSNSAATALMSPIVHTLLEELQAAKLMKFYLDDEGDVTQGGKCVSQPQPSRTTICYFLSIAYAATIGGTGTIVGTGTNLVFKGIYETCFPEAPELNFLHWMAYAVPPMIVMQFLVWAFINWMFLGLFRKSGMDPDIEKQILKEDTEAAKQSQEAARSIFAQKIKDLGPIHYEEIITGVLFLFCTLLWIFRKPEFMEGWVGYVTQHNVADSAPCIIIILLFFMLPGDLSYFKMFSRDDNKWPKMESKGLLQWREVQQRMPWGLLLLLGGGFAVAEGSRKSGMSVMLANGLKGLGNLHPVLLMFLTGFITMSLTEFTANAPMANIILPILAEIAVVTETHPLELMLPAALCSSFAFMLPVGTPGNAFVAAMANIRTKDMMIAGAVPKLICLGVIVIFFPTWGNVIFDINSFPEWALNSTAS